MNKKLGFLTMIFGDQEGAGTTGTQPQISSNNIQNARTIPIDILENSQNLGSLESSFLGVIGIFGRGW